METAIQVLILFLIMMVGFLAKRLKLITNQLNNDLSNIILFISMPMWIVINLSSFEFSYSVLYNSGRILLLSIAFYLLTILFSYLVPILFKVKGKKKDVFQIAVVLGNVGFMGYPIINAIFGQDGIFYAAIFNIPFDVVTWTFCLAIVTREKRSKGLETEKIDYKSFFNPAILAVIIGMIMFLFRLKLPGFLHEAFYLIGSTTTPMAMILIGSMLADTNVMQTFADKKIVAVSLVKITIIPIIAYVLAILLNIQEKVAEVAIILAATPVAASVSIMAQRFESDYYLASQIIFVSTLLSVFTIPLILLLI